MIQDIWDKLTGKPKNEAPPEPETRQERGERLLQAEATRADERRLGIAPEQVQARIIAESNRKDAGEFAKKLEQPGPAERMINRNPAAEQMRQALEKERFARRDVEQEVADGKRPPIKSFSELHPKNGPTTPQL